MLESSYLKLLCGIFCMELELNSLDFITPISINYHYFDKKNPDQNIQKYQSMFDEKKGFI
jgi:hypothetical protein